MVAQDSTLHLLLLSAGCNDEAVVFAKASRLHQYRSFGNADATGLARREGFFDAPSARADTWMDDGAQRL